MRKKLTKSLLTKLVSEGKTQREIAKITGYSKSNVGHWIRRYDLAHLNDNKPSIDYKDKHYFNKIDTPEKAYVVGFFIADGYISERSIELTVALRDREILDFVQGELGGNVIVSNVLNREQKRHPNARLSFYDNTLIRDLIRVAGGTYKSERRLPIVSPNLEKYLLLGFFDGDGCVTWGARKDRSRIWQKISFTSQFKSLIGVQNILYNGVGLPSKIRPKSDGSDCFVLEFGGRGVVLEFLDYLYSGDLVVLNRKYQNANNLRLELEEFGKS